MFSKNVAILVGGGERHARTRIDCTKDTAGSAVIDYHSPAPHTISGIKDLNAILQLNV